MFEGSNRECNYPFHMKVTGLHLDGTMRWKGCSIHAQSKSVFQWALYIGCDIAKTYLFQCSCISQVPDHNYRRVIILGWCYKSCSLFRRAGCGTSAQRTQLTLSGCHATSLTPLLPPPPMMPTCSTIRQGHYFTLIAPIPSDGVPLTAGWRKDVLDLSIP